MVVCITIVAVLLVHTAFSIMAQYEVAKEIRESHTSMADIEDSPYEFSGSFKNTDEDYISKADMDRCIERIRQSIDALKECGNSIGIITMVSQKVDWHYEEPMDFEFKIELDKDGVKAPKEFFENLIKGGFFSEYTNGWTDEEEKKGWNTALVWNDSKVMIPPGYKTCPDTAYPTGTVRVGKNNYYHIGGWQTYSVNPIVPYSSLEDDFKIDSIIITFNEYLTEASFGHLYNIFTEELGDRVVLRSDSVKKAKKTMYSTIFAVSILIVILSVVNHVLLLSYLVEKRKKQTRSYMIVGVSKKRLSAIYLFEYVLINTIVYALTLFTFIKLILPKLELLLPYCAKLFTPTVYTIIFLCFTGLIIVLGYIANLKEFKKAGWR